MSNPNAPTVARTTAPAQLSTPGLVLLYGSTPNGWKCTYALEILKQAGAIQGYTVCEVYLQNGEQFQPWFRQINPNCESLEALMPLPSLLAGLLPSLAKRLSDFERARPLTQPRCPL